MPEGYGEWIEYKPGDSGPRVNEMVHVLEQKERDEKYFNAEEDLANEYLWSVKQGSTIVAYCIKKPDANQ